MICSSCKVVIREYVFTDKVERDYCLECAQSHPLLGEAVAYEFLAETIPFKVGDRVDVQIHPLRDGQHGGSLSKIILTDTGQVLTSSLLPLKPAN